VGFYHLLNENYAGAESQLSKGLLKLEDFKPVYQGIELSEFLNKVQICLSQVQALKAKTLNQFDVSWIPKIQWV
jgi:predicted metal-dependent hydrolase